jgi:hypothetical protein
LFILQAGYFKAKTLFFSFEIDEVADDVKHVLQQHYPQYHDAALNRRSSNRPATRNSANCWNCTTITLAPVPSVQHWVPLVQYLETHRVVAPGYSFLQDVVSRALGKERGRVTRLLDTRLDEATRKALDRHYLERDRGYRVTPLKQDPKDFSRSEMRRGWLAAGRWSLCTEPPMALLPELGISNDSITYYAALVDYYTVQKLQQLTQSMARLYLLCFLLQRYQRINDNLINALIYQVRKVLSAAKVCLQERLLSDSLEGSKNVQHLGRSLIYFSTTALLIRSRSAR